jgi:antitoxin HicB
LFALYLTEFPDLPRCVLDGEMIEEAIVNSGDAKRYWITAMGSAGRPVPPPSIELAESYRGKWQLHAPKSLASSVRRARQTRRGEVYTLAASRRS